MHTMTHTPATARRGATRRGGFTLVELLVVISVIAALIGILLPALSGGIKAARSARCLSNHHQIALAWIMYTTDHTTFPYSGWSPELTWGGVDWYTDEAYETGAVPLAANRPVNPYIGSEERDQARAEVFQCPSDNGLFEWGSGDRYHYSFQPEYENPFGDNPRYESRAEDAGESVFSVIGTSYRANDWLWMKPGSYNGAFQPPGGTSSANKPDMVVDHSRFVLVADAGMTMIGRADLDVLGNFPLPYAWWHGEGRCHFACLDGSGRAHDMTHGTASTREYTYFFDDRLHEPWSKVFAFFRGGNPPRPEAD